MAANPLGAHQVGRGFADRVTAHVVASDFGRVEGRHNSAHPVVAGAWRFKRSDLDSWIDMQKKAAQTKT